MKMISVKKVNNLNCLVHQRKMFHGEEMKEANKQSSESSDEIIPQIINQTEIGDDFFN